MRNKPNEDSGQRMLRIIEILNSTESSGYYVVPSAPGGYSVVLLSTADMYIDFECLNEMDGGEAIAGFSNRKDVFVTWIIEKITMQSIVDSMLRLNNLVKTENLPKTI